MPKGTILTKDKIHNIIRGARREVDISLGIGLNNKRAVFVDRRKKENKNYCRKGKSDE
jgi:hypothetical protein